MPDSARPDPEREVALRAHERGWQMQNQSYTSVISIGANALRSANFIAGGSVVVSLAFVGAIFGQEPETARRLLWAVFVFGLASVAAGAASGFTYLSQDKYAESTFNITYSWTHPYLIETE